MSERKELDGLGEGAYYGVSLFDPINVSKKANTAVLGTPGCGKAFRIDQKESQK